MRILTFPGRVTGGEINLGGKDLLKLSDKEMRNYRGRNISMIFQDPMTSLTPVYTIGNQMDEAVRLHTKESYDCDGSRLRT